MKRFIIHLLHKFTHVQALTPRHAEVISNLHDLCFPAGWSEDDMHLMLNDPKVQGAGLFLLGFLLGFILSRAVGDEAEILTIATHPVVRGMHIGRKLLNFNIIQLARRQATSLFLEVAVDNVPALKLYIHSGFSQVGQRKAYYHTYGQPPQDALILRRPIEPAPHYVHGYIHNV